MRLTGSRVRRTLPVTLPALLLAAGILATAPPAFAQATPTRFSFDFDVTLQSATWTSRCGVPVFFRDAGTVKVALFHDRDGDRVISEIDTAPGEQFTWFSPLEAGGTGKSFSYIATTVVRTVYPDGAYVGAPAIEYLTARGGFVPPAVTSAGLVVLEGIVVFITPEGLPLVDVTGILARDGYLIDQDSFIAARCEFFTSQ